jgi:hypothetical protein
MPVTDPTLVWLLKWLREHGYELSAWPPHFDSEVTGTLLIADWNRIEEKLDGKDEDFLKLLDGKRI